MKSTQSPSSNSDVGYDADVLVVGGGAAGLSAALVLGRARRRVTVVDAGNPRNAPAGHMQGYLSRDGMSPTELLAAGRAEVARYGVTVLHEAVASVEAGFTVQLASGTVLTARRLLVTTGLRDELPDIAGVRGRWGNDVLHRPYCHGWEVRDQPLGVLGTHPDAVLHALLVRQWSADVAYFAHTSEPTAVERAQLEARGIQIVTGQVARVIVEGDALAGVELTNGQVVARSAVFIQPHNMPHDDTFRTSLLTGLRCATNGAGFLSVDATGRTSTSGVWAAGNATDPRAQVITAAGAGSAAAIALNTDLVAEDVILAVQRAQQPMIAAARWDVHDTLSGGRWGAGGRRA